MRIGGFQEFSLIDFPGKMAAVVFTQGCNFRCRYCHNPELISFRPFGEEIEENTIFDFLKKRKDQLEGVVITGGEPTLQRDLVEFIRKVKDYGYAVKLDTNGSSPSVLASLIEKELVDFIAMDLKTSWANYEKVVGVHVSTESVKKSIELILACNFPYEFRATIVKSLHTLQDLQEMTSTLEGARKFVIQQFNPNAKIFDTSLLAEERFTAEEIKEFKNRWSQLEIRTVN